MKKAILLYEVVFIILLSCPILAAQKAVDFTLKDLEGNPITLSQIYKENIVLLNFWATWCLPCAKELPHLQRMFDTYKDKGLQILTINVDGPGTLAQVQTFIQRYGYSYPVLLDSGSNVVALYNPRVILPYSVLIDRGGRIVSIHQGYSPGDEVLLEEKISELFEPAEVVQKEVLSYQINETFLFRNFFDEDFVTLSREGRSSQIINHFDLLLNWKNILVGTRIDSRMDLSPIETEFILGKRFAAIDLGSFRMRLGDFYHSLGRGLSFSLLKTFEEEGLEHLIDTTLDGGYVYLEKGILSFEALGGWIEREDSNISDKILGGTIRIQPLSLGTFSIHLLGSRMEPGSKYGNKDVFIPSVSIDLPKIAKKISFYGEFSLIQKNSYFSLKKDSGHGIYLESSFLGKELSILLEFKDYKHLNYEYNRPPLLEAEQLDILASQFDDDAMDSTGISLGIHYKPQNASHLFFGSIKHLISQPEKHPFLGSYERKIFHVYGGIEKTFKETGYLNVLAGWRDEENTSLVFLNFAGRTFHYQANLSYPLSSRLSIEVDWKSKTFKGKFVDYFERRAYLSLHYSSLGIATLLFEQTDDPEIFFLYRKKNWWAGQVEIRITSANIVRILIGSTKGSVKCAGGICRFFPPFEGLRIEANLRF